jgi:hypothetical protein
MIVYYTEYIVYQIYSNNLKYRFFCFTHVGQNLKIFHTDSSSRKHLRFLLFNTVLTNLKQKRFIHPNQAAPNWTLSVPVPLHRTRLIETGRSDQYHSHASPRSHPALTPGITKAIHGGGGWFAPTSGGGGAASPSVWTSAHSDSSPGSAHGGSVSRGSRSRRHPRSRHGSHGRP